MLLVVEVSAGVALRALALSKTLRLEVEQVCLIVA